MKYVSLILLAALLIIVTEGHVHLTEKHRKARRACLDALNLNYDIDMDFIYNMNRTSIKNDAKLSEFVLCESKKMGFINEEGKLQQGSLKFFLFENGVDWKVSKKFLDQCAHDQATPEETAITISYDCPCLQLDEDDIDTSCHRQ